MTTNHDLLSSEGKKHHEWGASKCERLIKCARSTIESRGEPNKPNQYSAEGQVAHEMAFTKLMSRFFPESADRFPVFSVGEKILQEGFEIEVDADMDRYTDEYVDLIVSYVEKYNVPHDLMFFEQRVMLPIPNLDCEECSTLSVCPSCNSCSSCFGPCDCEPQEVFGTADCALVVPFDRIIVFDLKYGKGLEVQARDNKQLLFYAAGVRFAKNLATYMQDIDWVEAVIHQPRVPYGNSVKDVCFKTDELDHFYHREFIPAVFASTDINAGYNPGESWCKYCPAAYKCPALKQMLGELAIDEFASVTVPNNFTLPNIDNLTDFEISVMLDNFKMIETFMNAVRQRAFIRELNSPGSIPNYKVVEKRTHRKFIDPAAVEESFSMLGDSIWKKTLVTPSQLEKILVEEELKQAKADNVKLTKKAATEAVKSLVETLTYKPEGAKTLVPVKDSRPEVIEALQEFSDVDIDEL